MDISAPPLFDKLPVFSALKAHYFYMSALNMRDQFLADKTDLR